MVITVERNARTGLYHPFVWREAPPPSDDGKDPVTRFRSKLHHTAGFATREEALAHVPELSAHVRENFGTATERLGLPPFDMTWEDGEVPTAARWMERETA